MIAVYILQFNKIVIKIYNYLLNSRTIIKINCSNYFLSPWIDFNPWRRICIFLSHRKLSNSDIRYFQHFKNLVASLAVWIGAEIGSYLAMLLGRYVFRDAVSKRIK